MRTLVVKSPGGLDRLQLEQRDAPQPSANEVLVRWYASSLNFHDYLVANGSIPVADNQIPMSDGAGEVVEVGAEVSQWQIGDKVMGLFFPNWHDGPATPVNTRAVSGESVDGFASEYSLQKADALTPIPNDYSYAQAASLPCAALTAWRALVVEGNIKAGDTVLVEGSGGVSVFALQIAKAFDAYVYATTSSDEKADRLTALGANKVINYREDEKWGKTVFRDCGGANHVLDVGGGATLAQSVEAVGFGGHISLIGILGGRSGEFVLPKMFFKHAHMHGIAVANKQAQIDMVNKINESGLQPVIDRDFDLADLAEAFRYQESAQHFGKITVSI